MKPALITLATTLRAGVNTRNIQFATARKTCTWYGNVHNTGAGYDGRLVEDTGGGGGRGSGVRIFLSHPRGLVQQVHEGSEAEDRSGYASERGSDLPDSVGFRRGIGG
ncbi:hypothetical protein ACHAXR_001263 [Thalassiosira sp. AJA248-18]